MVPENIFDTRPTLMYTLSSVALQICLSSGNFLGDLNMNIYFILTSYYMGLWLLCGVIGVWFGQLAQVVVGKVFSRTRVLFPVSYFSLGACMWVEKDCDHVNCEYAWSLYVLIINLNLKKQKIHICWEKKEKNPICLDKLFFEFFNPYLSVIFL
jgi:hypothetical protein